MAAPPTFGGASGRRAGRSGGVEIVDACAVVGGEGNTCDGLEILFDSLTLANPA
jgi:hypothetical protein